MILPAVLWSRSDDHLRQSGNWQLVAVGTLALSFTLQCVGSRPTQSSSSSAPCRRSLIPALPARIRAGISVPCKSIAPSTPVSRLPRFSRGAPRWSEPGQEYVTHQMGPTA